MLPRYRCKVVRSVCPSVAISLYFYPLACLKQLGYTYKCHQMFCKCCLWPWLGSTLTAVRYVMYFRFCGRRYVFTKWSELNRITNDDAHASSSSPGGGTGRKVCRLRLHLVCNRNRYRSQTVHHQQLQDENDALMSANDKYKPYNVFNLCLKFTGSTCSCDGNNNVLYIIVTSYDIQLNRLCYFTRRAVAKYCDEYVCVCVCVCVSSSHQLPVNLCAYSI